MASLIGRILSKLQREQPQDAFGGEDLYDGDEPPRRLSQRIALAVSGLLFALLIGFGVTIYIIGKDAPPLTVVMAPLEGLQVEEDTSEPAAAPAASPAAAPKSAAPVDTTATTDRSSNRRPWLASTPDQKPAAPQAPAAPIAPPPAPAAVAKAPPAAMTPPAPSTPVPPVSKVPPPGPVTAAAVPPPGPMPSVLSKPHQPEPPPAAPVTADAGSTAPVDVAPGAPERFAEKGELMSGGRPRLADPPLPPVDRASMGAPPPRFGNIATIKVKTAAADKTAKTGKVAVIVQGLGLSEAATEAAVTKLPKEVALSFSPYAHDLRKWLKQSKDNGHEVLVEVPMESKAFPAEDPGPLGLMTTLEPKENTERLKSILKISSGAIGIDDIMGSKFRESETPMRDVFNALKQGNLIYVQGRPGVRIGEPGVPNTIADLVLDERPFRAAIDARLDYTERLAKFQGSVVAVLGPKPVSYERLALWLDQIDKRGIQLAPLSQVLVR